MSVISMKWACSQKVDNVIAKFVLVFLAGHNFGGDQSCFKVKTIARVTEADEGTIRRALRLLTDRGFITKQPRFAPSGQQLSNEYTLNISEEYKDNFYKDYGVAPDEKITTGVVSTPVDNYSKGSRYSEGGVGREPKKGGEGGGRNTYPPLAETHTPPLAQRHPLNNNINNNNINIKSSCPSDKKSTSKELFVSQIEKPKIISTCTSTSQSVNQNVASPPANPWKQSEPWAQVDRKAENEKKHGWAEPKAALASVTNQSTSYSPNFRESEEPSPILAAWMKRQKEETQEKINAQSPLETPEKTNPTAQNEAIDENQGKAQGSHFRTRYGRVSAQSVGALIQQTGLPELLAKRGQTETHTEQVNA